MLNKRSHLLMDADAILYLYARFDAKVEPEPNSGCWLWSGARTPDGYGSINLCRPRIQRQAHIIAYERRFGPVPIGMVLDHLCRVRACVNPEHMEVVTRGENVLRGVGFAAVNAKKTHCAAGHPFDAGNTRRTGAGWRKCITCESSRRALRMARAAA